MSDKIRVLNIDSHPLWCVGVASVINRQPDMRLVAQASTGGEAIDYFRKHQPDVILMDVQLPDINGIEFMMAIRAECPNARFIILTSFAQVNEIRRALAQGAQAYLLKSVPSSELVEVIRQVHAGKRKISTFIAEQLVEHYTDELLSDREVEVLRRLLDGNRNRDIAEKLFIAEETVKAHMKHIMNKLGANDRTQALTIALRRGLIQLVLPIAMPWVMSACKWLRVEPLTVDSNELTAGWSANRSNFANPGRIPLYTRDTSDPN